MLLLLQHLWVTVLSLVHAKGNKHDRSAQAVQDKTSLTSVATRAGFSMAPRPQFVNAHGSHSVVATIRPLEVRMTPITRGWLCRDGYSDKSEREGPFGGNTHECGMLQDLLISTAAVSEYFVCGILCGPKAASEIIMQRSLKVL